MVSYMVSISELYNYTTSVVGAPVLPALTPYIYGVYYIFTPVPSYHLQVSPITVSSASFEMLCSNTALNVQSIFECRIFSEVQTIETTQSEVDLLQ